MPIQNVLFKYAYRRNNLYAHYYEKEKVTGNTVLYESRDGKSLTDSPYAIFKYLLNHPDFSHYTHIWALQDSNELKRIAEEYKKYNNIIFIKRNSKDYIKALATSKYLINNSTFQSFFIPKENQTYINTWHGTPLKKMGFEIPGNPSASKNVLRNFLSADYLLSPNAHTTKMFTESYKLEGIYGGTILEDGYPRIDLTLNSDTNEVKKKIKKFDLDLDEAKETILYAPTWKGNNVAKARNDMFQIISDMQKLRENVSTKYNILIKVHPYLYETAKKYEEIADILVPDSTDTNELLSIVDLLITDYSSIFFDYLVTGKPILYYMWDAESYSEERGSYFSLEELPGPILYTIPEVINTIQNIENVFPEYSDKYNLFQHQFAGCDDGQVTKRMINYIFKGKKDKIKTITGLDQKKEKIILYPGGMMNNGITSSCINLLNNIDYEKYDVSCFMKVPNKTEALQNIEKINKNVHLLFRNGLSVYSTDEWYRDKLIQNRGASQGYLKKLFPEKAYRREVKRYFGKTKFDIAIDFSGYSLFWAKYILATDAKNKICFMHNDLLADSEKVINHKRPHRINLRGLFSIYNRFDKLVSVSKGTMELNRHNLKEFADESKFDFVMNSINPEKIIRASNEEMEKNNEAQIQKEQTILENKKFISRAIISNANGNYIWNKPVHDESAKKITSATKYENQEVTISWETNTVVGKFYKFSIEDTIIGWLNKESFKLLPDSILSEIEVNRLVTIVRTKGNAIWNKPYNVYNTSRVSYSGIYKNVMFEVDKEVRTEHGLYSRITLKGDKLGWIDSGALNVIKDYTNSDLSNEKVTSEIKKLTTKNYNSHKLLLDLWPNRTLREQKINKLGNLVNLEKYDILSALPCNPKSRIKKEIDKADLKNKMVQLVQVSITRDAIYYLIFYENQRIGWINRKALKISNMIQIIDEKKVNKITEIDLSEDYGFWTQPYGLLESEKIKRIEFPSESKFIINKEVHTQNGYYSHLILDNTSVGWINKKALKNTINLGIEIGNKFISNPSEKNINFVNMGRLSPEKGQNNLIEAFSIFHKSYNNSRLYILGHGPLQSELQNLILELDIESAVYLVGQQENPFKLLKKCDCFVLSSHYEGQPMVLLEAMTLGLDIIATDIVANRTVLENGRYGVLVEDSIEGLVAGFKNYVKNNHSKTSESFNYQEYNMKAMENFYEVIRN